MIRRKKSPKPHHPRHSKPWHGNQHCVENQSSLAAVNQSSRAAVNQSSRAAVNNYLNKPPGEWQRCAEGFQHSVENQSSRAAVNQSSRAAVNQSSRAAVNQSSRAAVNQSSRAAVNQSSRAAVNKLNEPPGEWQRCAEGFQSASREQPGPADGNSRTEHHSSEVKTRPQFGQKWIQSEELWQISQSSALTSRSGPHTVDLKSALRLNSARSDDTVEDNADLDSICWNNSDSDTEDSKKQRIPSPPAKRRRTNCPPPKTKQKRKSAQFQTLPPALKPDDLEKCDDDESEDEILSASESEEEKEKAACVVQGASHQSGASRESPVLQIECTGSPQGASSSTPEESSHFVIRDPEDEALTEASPGKVALPEAATPSISSCASSQRTGDSEESPGQAGLRASEWAKQMKWETTPTKQGPVTPAHQADSGKKRKKFSKGGLAEQMCRLLQREKSARSVWQHQHKTEATAEGASCKRMTVRVQSMQTAYGVHLARCSVVCSPCSVQLGTSAACCLLFSPLSAKHKADFQQGATVHVCPPWQQVETEEGKALLCTRYHVSHHTSADDLHSDGEDGTGDSDAPVDLSASPVSSHGRWMCACSDDTSLPATKCPAHLFPFLPSSITQHPATLTSKPSKSGKALHTVTVSEGAPKRTLTFNTLLESMEKAPAGDRLLPSFQASVLRVFHQQAEAGSIRQSVLVEDSQGTVAIISGGSSNLSHLESGASNDLSHLEGRLCSFSCLRVHSRTNADRDLALFSAVWGAWSCREGTAASSQDSDSVPHRDSSLHPSRPPGFCYLLEVDRGACSVREGGDWLTVSPSPPSPPPPPLQLTSLVEALKSQKQRRVSVLGKLLYFTARRLEKDAPEKPGDENNSVTTSAVYITDPSLQKGLCDQNSTSALHITDSTLQKCPCDQNTDPSLQKGPCDENSTSAVYNTDPSLHKGPCDENSTSAVYNTDPSLHKGPCEQNTDPSLHKGPCGQNSTSSVYPSLQKGGATSSEEVSVKQNEQRVTAPPDQCLEEGQRSPAFVKVDVRPDCVTSNIRQESGALRKNQPVLVLLRDVWCVEGSWVADKYSRVVSLQPDGTDVMTLRARVDGSTYDAVSQCSVALPALCASSESGSLVSVSGTIQGVDEKSAFSWEECDGCGSDQLATRAASQSLVCLSCRKPVVRPVQRMKMDVVVESDTVPPITVTISLQQPTIEELLPEEEEEEGYDVDCVLGKAVGPVKCVLTSTDTPLTAVQLPC